MTAKLISAFVFATRILQSLYFLNRKFQASSHLQWLYSPVCVGPGRQPRRPVFSQRGSYECKTCGKSFNYNGSYNRHLRIHNGSETHICDTCGKTFNSNYNLTRHLLTHSGNKPYKCEICGKSFSEKKHLTRHVFIHTGENPFVCGTCGKSFKEKVKLTRHLIIHSGYEPNTHCISCRKLFIDKYKLTKHLLMQNRASALICKYCGTVQPNRKTD